MSGTGKSGGGDVVGFRVDADGKVLARRDDDVEIAVFGNDRPPAERAQHGAIEAVDTYVDGKRARATLSLDTVERMRLAGSITTGMAAAARGFAAVFRDAAFATLHAASLEWQPGPGRGLGGDMSDEHAAAVSDARRQVHIAMRALGGHASPAARAVWYVIGEGEIIEVWTRRERWSGGRTLSRIAGGGVLIGALGVLESIYIGGEFRGNPRDRK